MSVLDRNSCLNSLQGQNPNDLFSIPLSYFEHL